MSTDLIGSHKSELIHILWNRSGLIEFTESKLGIDVEPEHIRLMPRPGDGYIWKQVAAEDESPLEKKTLPAEKEALQAKKKTPRKEHLFTKQLSKLSVGAYMELIRGVNVWFEAIAEPRPGNVVNSESQGAESTGVNMADGSTSNASFTSRIDYLRTTNARLADELEDWRERAQTDSEARQRAEEKVEQLQMDLGGVQRYARKLEQRNIHLSSRVKYAERKAVRSTKGINKMLSILQKLSSEPPVFREEE